MFRIASKIAAVALLGLALSGPQLAVAQGQASRGAAVTRSFTWSGGHSLRVSAPADVIYTQAGAPGIVISGPKDLVDRVRVEGGRIYMERNWSWGRIDWGRDRLAVSVTAPNLDSFSAAASAKMVLPKLRVDNAEVSASSAAVVSGDFTARTLKASASSSGRFTGDVQVTDLTVDASSAGGVVLTGRATTAVVEVSSSGKADLYRVSAESVRARASSSGSASVNANKSADLGASSAGGIRMARRPASTTVNTSSGGHVRFDDRAEARR